MEDKKIFEQAILAMEERYSSGYEEEIDAYFRGAKWLQKQDIKELKPNPLLMDEVGHWDFRRQRMYSEEDMAESFMACWKANVPEGFECKLSFNEWFEQFKKK